MSGTVFISGGSGLLALNWASSLRQHHAVVLGLHEREVALSGAEGLRCSLDSVEGAGRALDAVTPAIVVNSVGLTNVDACESNPALARHVNVDVSSNIAMACARRGIALIHISTDHLFQGDDALVSEDQPVFPKNVYGRTKAEAEQQVLHAHPDALVVRTNFYGWGTSFRRSFSDTVIDALRIGKPLSLFTDAFYTPIHVDRLREAVFDLVSAGASGIVNVVGDERLSKHAFGLKVAMRFELDAELIRPATLRGFPGLAPRPLDMSLSNAKARHILGRPLGQVDEHLALLLQQERAGVAQELRTL